MLVLAGPGSGKTKVLTERIRILIEQHNVKPNEILVITFSKKSAQEMKNRFISLINGANYQVNFGTFHSIFYQILKHHKQYTLESILKDNEKLSIISEIGFNLKINNYNYSSWQLSIVKMISGYKNNGEDYLSSLAISDSEKNDFLRVYASYKKECRINNKLDFDDMILECLDMFMKHESILKIWREYFKYILVDEFQDINESQYKVLRLLAGDDKNVFCVGDDDQSIYAFRGAKPSIMQRFLREFPSTKRVDLSINYRCKENIVDAADRLIRNNKLRIERDKQNVFFKESSGIVKVVESLSTLKQAETVCNKIITIKEAANIDYKDFAVIYRSGHCAKMFEIKADEFHLPIKSTQTKFDIYKTKIFRSVISYFKVAMDQGTRSDLLLCINCPKRGISREALSYDKDACIDDLYEYYKGSETEIIAINEFVDDLKYIKTLTPYAAFVYLLKKVKLFDYLKRENSNEGIPFEDIIELIEDMLRTFNTINGFLYSLEAPKLNCENDFKLQDNLNCNETNKDKVNLLTAHASKGLEFKVVFIIGLQEGDFPHNKSLHGSSLEEERRLMYVAMTRAKEELYLCSVSSGHAKQQSRFISEAITLS